LIFHGVWVTQITVTENTWHSATLLLVNPLFYFRRGAL
jgi:hypothetical protein